MKIVILTGPTASGKTRVAAHLTDKHPNLFQIISVDSVMVYKECNIGSGKPTPKELKKYPHDLINHLSLPNIFTAYDFLKESHTILDACKRNNKIPLFVGGSMMYLNTLKNGLNRTANANQDLREALLAEEKESPGILHKKLTRLNSNIAERLASNDLVRLIRAIEQIQSSSTGEEINGINASALIELALFPEDRELLHTMIENRQHQIVGNGLLDECKNIQINFDLPKHHPINKAVNYKQGFDVLNNRISHKELFQKSLIATRQLAKKQLTWIRSWQKIKLFDLNSGNKAIRYIEKSLEI